MYYPLLDNGADSLKAAHENIKKYEAMAKGTEHNLKDALILLNHGIEILLKLILSERSQSLMFTDIKQYMKAKANLKKNEKSDVFEVDPSLRTITLEEALQRVEYLCDIDIPDKFKAVILHLNKIRNRLMHYGVIFDYDSRSDLLVKMKVCHEESVRFFETHILGLNEKINDARFYVSLDEYTSDDAWLALEANEDLASLEHLEYLHTQNSEDK